VALCFVVALVIAACGSGTASTSTEPASTTSTSADSTVIETTTATSSSTTATPTGQSVRVYFATGDGSDCGEVTGFDRTIADDLDPVLMAFDLLVAGPTVEEMGAGASSFFSDESSGALGTLSLTDGLLVVDFHDIRQLLSNASTSCGGQSLLAQLNATAFQFDEVDRVRYEIEGSCDTFSQWLQRECEEYTRAGAEPAPVTTNERASGSGCMPGSDTLPDGRWFGFVAEADESEVSFDLACWFTGSAAADAAAEDGEESPPPNDYYIRNENEQLRQVPVASDATVQCLCSDTDSTELIAMTYAEWLSGRATRTYQPGVWIEVADGAVSLIEEQYVP
jgi:hypothetical protein